MDGMNGKSGKFWNRLVSNGLIKIGVDESGMMGMTKVV